jgi:hypothetical protein
MNTMDGIAQNRQEFLLYRPFKPSDPDVKEQFFQEYLKVRDAIRHHTYLYKTEENNLLHRHFFISQEEASKMQEIARVNREETSKLKSQTREMLEK